MLDWDDLRFFLAVARTGSFTLAIILALLASLIAGMVLEVIAIRPLYGRDHLDQAKDLLHALGRPDQRP